LKIGLGERIRKLRKGLGLTQKEFAGRVPGRVDYSYIEKMERDRLQGGGPRHLFLSSPSAENPHP